MVAETIPYDRTRVRTAGSQLNDDRLEPGDCARDRMSTSLTSADPVDALPRSLARDHEQILICIFSGAARRALIAADREIAELAVERRQSFGLIGKHFPERDDRPERGLEEPAIPFRPSGAALRVLLSPHLD